MHVRMIPYNEKFTNKYKACSFIHQLNRLRISPVNIIQRTKQGNCTGNISVYVLLHVN